MEIKSKTKCVFERSKHFAETILEESEKWTISPYPCSNDCMYVCTKIAERRISFITVSFILFKIPGQLIRLFMETCRSQLRIYVVVELKVGRMELYRATHVYTVKEFDYNICQMSADVADARMQLAWRAVAVEARCAFDYIAFQMGYLSVVWIRSWHSFDLNDRVHACPYRAVSATTDVRTTLLTSGF